MLSEKTQLLSKGFYADIPDVITLKSIPTSSELEFVGSEEFDKTMLDVIFPKIIEEKFDYYNLLEVDYQWICRCARILNYGPYYTTNAIFCGHCNEISNTGEYQVDLRTINVISLPEKFKNEMVIARDKFLDFNSDIVFHLPTMREVLASKEDNAFKMSNGEYNRELARICYMITQIGTTKGQNPVDIKLRLSKELSSADYIILKDEIKKGADYGLRIGGTAMCPNCGKEASYFALADDRFFRPTVGDLYAWRDDRRRAEEKNTTGNTTKNV